MRINHSFDPEFDRLMEEIYTRTDDGILKLEGIHPDQLDVNKATRAFFRMTKEGQNTAEVSIDANANVAGKDTITYAYELAKPVSKLNSLYNLWLSLKESIGQENADLCIKANVWGHLYINDGWDVGRPYCFNYSTLDIAMEGLKMSNRLDVAPPKSLASFLHQVEQFTVYAANSTLGATGLADLLLVVAGYVQRIAETGYDHHVRICNTGPTWDMDRLKCYVKEQLTSLIYTLNWEFRGNQSPFTNVSVYDKHFLEQLLPSYYILGNPVQLPTVQFVQEWFLECMNETLVRTPITFPVVTACFSTNEEDGSRSVADTDFLETISEANLKFGFINIYMGKSSTLSSCCRLRSESDGLGYSNSFGSGSTKIGSMGVVTLNLPRMAMEAEGESEEEAWCQFLDLVRGAAILAGEINNAKRNFLKDRISRGSLPLYDLGYMDIRKQYSTCGFTGLYEAVSCFNFDVATDEGVARAKEVLSAIRAANKYLTEKYGTPHNMEQTPAESSAVKLAEKDRIIGFLDEEDDEDIIYSNQFIPLTDGEVDIFTRIKVQGQLDPYCDGGSILHINTKQPVGKSDMMKALINYACSHGVVYFAVNYLIHQCEHGHVWAGPKEDCPLCGSPSKETFTRVVGFLTSIKHWNKQRKKYDFPNRHFYEGA